MSDFDRIHDKLDTVSEQINNIDKTLIRQEEHLKEHMRRSLANEQAIEILKNEFKPVHQHVFFVNTVVKIAISTGAILLFLQQIGLLKKLLDLF